jgi:radical SAM protein with 4Fe4S-binding SPASM domain
MSKTGNIYSDLKIAWFPDKLVSMRDRKIEPPIYVRVKPINRCNHHCFFCVYHEPEKAGMHEDMNSKDVLPTSKWYEILDDFNSMGVRAVTYSGGGEPLMHSACVDLMNRTLELGIDLSIITNGQLLSGDRAMALRHAKWVRVSIDYHDPEQFEQNRRTSKLGFNQIMDNIRAFAAMKDPDCDFGINFIVHKGNCAGLAVFATNMKSMGAENVRFSPMWIKGFREYHMPIQQQVEDELAKASVLIDDTFHINTTYNLDFCGFSLDRPYTRCHFGQVVPVIGADQNVYACHNKAYDHTGLIGSIRDKTFEQVWMGGEAAAFFDQLNPQQSCRHQCANCAKNQIIQKMINSSGDPFV